MALDMRVNSDKAEHPAAVLRSLPSTPNIRAGPGSYVAVTAQAALGWNDLSLLLFG